MKNNQTGMTLIVKTITRLTVGLILVYGIYIVLQGHISPGGGFAGGVIITLSFVQLMLAFGKDTALKKVNQAKCIFLSGVAAFIFLILAVCGFVTGHSPGFRDGHSTFFSAGLVPFCDIAISVLVGSGLFVIFLALVLLTQEQE
ncbi:MAG: MnhB domain-containing protein [Candidatus Omnitrophica bacterium]|jgi:multicomponent Na+:H+ antiporter subunit B|nr:MnhB domain-containing protein [Candidatus Omnitrophota bacterium]